MERISRAGRIRISRKKARETAAGSRAVVANITREKTWIITGITAISGGIKGHAMTKTARRMNKKADQSHSKTRMKDADLEKE